MKLPEILWIPLTSFGALIRRHFNNDLRTVRSYERRWRRAMKVEEITSRAVSERRFGDSFPHKLSGNDWRNGQIDWTHGTLGYGYRSGPDRSLFRGVELHRPTLMEWLKKHFPTALSEPGAPSGVDTFHTSAHAKPTTMNLIEPQTIRRVGKVEPSSAEGDDLRHSRWERQASAPAKASVGTAAASRLLPVTQKWADQFAQEYMDKEKAAGRQPTQCGLENAAHAIGRRGGRNYLRKAFHRLQHDAGFGVKSGPPKKLNRISPPDFAKK